MGAEYSLFMQLQCLSVAIMAPPVPLIINIRTTAHLKYIIYLTYFGKT